MRSNTANLVIQDFVRLFIIQKINLISVISTVDGVSKYLYFSDLDSINFKMVTNSSDQEYSWFFTKLG